MKTDTFRRLLDDGAQGRISISSDAGPFDGSFGNLVYGLRLAVEAGMANSDAIRACTQIAARVCGLQESIGTLEPGKLADVLVVSGNPLEDIDALQRVEDVFLEGQRVPRIGRAMPTAPRPVSVGEC
jgi:imidazolonepropionase-like amidohydrolase